MKERSVGAVAVACTAFFIVHLFMLSNRRLEAVPYTFLLAITALAPVAFWWWLVSRLESTGARSVMTYVGAGVFLIGFVIYYRGGFVHFDALYAAIFVFLPVLQIFALGLIYVLDYAYRRGIRQI